MFFRAPFWAILTLAYGLGPLLHGAEPSAAQIDFFEKKIRPVLTEKCYSCHSLEAEKVKAELLLDSQEGVLRGGESGAILVKGEPEKSRLIRAIRYTDPDLQMPPKEQLSAEQIHDFEEWVKMGAPDPRPQKAARTVRGTNYWAFRPPRDQAIPKVKNKKWASQPIDYFILARLEQKKFAPARAADKRTLIRRATFDLTGLPPTPAEISAFLADNSPEAFARVVDRLLDSRHFGEQWGRHWLDVARYADSNGLENNQVFENAWRYRDYVIRSFNKDKPFDQFVREQIAGDLLPSSTAEDAQEKLIGTGFLVMGPKVLNEPEREKLVMDVADEQIEVTSRAFLGLTVSCARCHDHKFDPIPTKDYYALAGIFKSTATLNDGRGRGPGATPWIERALGSLEEAAKAEAFARQVSQIQSDLDAARQARRVLPGGLDSKRLAGIIVDNADAELTGVWTKSNYSTNFVDQNYLQDGAAHKGESKARFVPKLPKAGRYEVRVSYTPYWNRATNVPVTLQTARGVMKRMLNERLAPTVDKAFVSLGMFEFNAGTNGAVTISNEGTVKGSFVVADAVQFIPDGAMEMGMMMKPPEPEKPLKVLTPEEEDDLQVKLGELQANAPAPLPMAMAVRDGTVQNCRLNIRGDFQKLGDEVPRGFLSSLGKSEPLRTSETSGRLELADWIASPANPLTARVRVNRIWQDLFGKGLVASPDNFGSLGEVPTHPELLDFLAVRFMQEGWSSKKLIRMLMLSSTYQMSSEFIPAAAAKDPDNKLLWHMSRRRLGAEALRDSILLLSGQLDLEPFGPSSTNLANANPMTLSGDFVSNRRSIYQPVIRNNIPDLFQAFDFVDPHVSTGQRHVTSAATQALFVMNSPFILEQARLWSADLLRGKENRDETRIANAFEKALARPPTSEELTRSLRYLKDYDADVARSEPDATKRRERAWQSFCHALIASSEFRFLN